MSKSRDAFRTISEVAEQLDTPAHVLRFWESKFTQVKPVKRAGGRRYYRPADVSLLAGIKQLLHEDGLTIKGVQKVLREQGVKHVAALADTDKEDIPEAPMIEDAPYVEVEPDSGTVLPFAKREETPPPAEAAADDPSPVDEPEAEPEALETAAAESEPEVSVPDPQDNAEDGLAPEYQMIADDPDMDESEDTDTVEDPATPRDAVVGAPAAEIEPPQAEPDNVAEDVAEDESAPLMSADPDIPEAPESGPVSEDAADSAAEPKVAENDPATEAQAAPEAATEDEPAQATLPGFLVQSLDDRASETPDDKAAPETESAPAEEPEPLSAQEDTPEASPEEPAPAELETPAASFSLPPIPDESSLPEPTPGPLGLIATMPALDADGVAALAPHLRALRALIDQRDTSFRR